ncbi:MAG TPA: hypothetical protein VIM12_13335 [Noviherbaspirillum sp.]|jgi:hypothetical protein|uniref:hypothetical protein n=1 Tax=Noviherbaspirillum sp. TaxID=1926288 RepID=UPI002F94F76C
MASVNETPRCGSTPPVSPGVDRTGGGFDHTPEQYRQPGVQDGDIRDAPAATETGIGGPPAGGNAITFHNDGDKPLHLRFTQNAGLESIPDLVVPPGESRTVHFPQGWSGNWRSLAGGGDAFTLGEVAFQGWQGMTFYDDSRIEGSNAGLTIVPAGGGRLTGTLDNLLEGAPEDVLAYNAAGIPYGIRKSTVNDIQDPAVVGFLNERIPDGMGYTYPTDDLSTAGTHDTHLVVRMDDFI